MTNKKQNTPQETKATSSNPEDVSKKTSIPSDTDLSILSHYLHNANTSTSCKREEVNETVREYIIKNSNGEVTEEYITKVAENPLQYGLFSDFFNIPFPSPKNPDFTFIDLFAGMGGFRLAMQAQGGKCIFSSEWNKFAQKTYFANFGDVPFGDITLDSTKSYIPKYFDILCAGFPCQPFSIAGVSKKKSLGRETGFKDITQGTLFFDVADIISTHRPKAFFLENVKNLVSHDKGNTFEIIRNTLLELRYSFYFLVMDGQAYVPQHRERIMMVGFNKEIFNNEEEFNFPVQTRGRMSIKQILDPEVDDKYTLSDKLWTYLQDYAEKHKAKGNGFGFGLVDLDGISRTLSARYYKDGSEILIPQHGKNPRRLSPRECARLMGYPDSYRLEQVSDAQAYRQCGNSVVVPLISAVSEEIIKTINNYEQRTQLRNTKRSAI